MQSLLKVTPAAVMNARNKPRWEYTVQFHTGINHDGFDHYPNAGQRPAFIFMFFAKERDVPATSGEHKLIGFAVTPLPTNLPTNGNQMRFRNIPIHRVNLHFKPVGGKNTGKSKEIQRFGAQCPVGALASTSAELRSAARLYDRAWAVDSCGADGS